MGFNAESRSSRGFLGGVGRAPHIEPAFGEFASLGGCSSYKSLSASLRLCVKNSILVIILAFTSPTAFALAENAYTNHAGNVVSGVVIALDARTVTISNATEAAKLPLSIFPESEQRRIAADAGQPRVPVAVKRAIAGADKAMARSRKRAEKGLCTQEESEAFCAKSESALKTYLDKQVKEGVITPAERKALRR